jgi:hypothetical protein
MKILNKTQQINKRCYEIQDIINLASKEKDALDRQYYLANKKWFKDQMFLNYLKGRGDNMNKIILTLIDYKNELKEQITD